MKRLALLFAALASVALAAEGPAEATISVSGTSASATLSAGFKTIYCTVAAHYRLTRTASTALTSDMPVPATTHYTVQIGPANRLALVTEGASGTCYVYQRNVPPNAFPPAQATNRNTAIADPLALSDLYIANTASIALVDAGVAIVQGTLNVGGALTGGDDGAVFSGNVQGYNLDGTNRVRTQRLELFPTSELAGDQFSLYFAGDGSGAIETTPWGVRSFTVGTQDAGSFNFAGGPVSINGALTSGDVGSFAGIDAGSITATDVRVTSNANLGGRLSANGSITSGGVISGNIDAGLVHTQTLVIQPVTSGSPTCSGGLGGANTNKFVSQAAGASTTATYYCNGDQWLFVGAPHTHCVSAASVAVSAGQSLGTMPYLEGASVLLRSCTFTVTSAGSGAGNIVYAVDHVASDGGVVAQLCKVPVPCTQADTTDVAAGCAADAGIPGVWSGSISNAQRVKLSIDTSACGNRPSGEFCCSYNLGVPALPL